MLSTYNTSRGRANDSVMILMFTFYLVVICEGNAFWVNENVSVIGFLCKVFSTVFALLLHFIGFSFLVKVLLVLGINKLLFAVFM